MENFVEILGAISVLKLNVWQLLLVLIFGYLVHVTPKGGLTIDFGRVKIDPQKKDEDQLDKNNKNKEKTTDSGNDTGDGN